MGFPEGGHGCCIMDFLKKFLPDRISTEGKAIAKIYDWVIE